MTYDEQTALNPNKSFPAPQSPPLPQGYYPPANPYLTPPTPPPQYGSSGEYYPPLQMGAPIYPYQQQPQYQQSQYQQQPQYQQSYQQQPQYSNQKLPNDDFNYERPTSAATTPPLSYHDLGIEEAQTTGCCGALGDCCGYNTPTSHSALRRIILMRKVFLVVLFQLLIVIGMCLLGIFVEQIRRILVNPKYFVAMWIIATILEIISLLVLFFVRHKFPWNFISLFIFTVSSGYFAMLLTAIVEYAIVLEAFILTFIIVSVLTLYTLIARKDFRFLGIYLFIGSLVFTMWVFAWIIAVWVFGVHFYWVHQIICLFGVLLFCGYLLFDLSLMIQEHCDDEYMLIAINIYLDILNIFIYILAFLGSDN